MADLKRVVKVLQMAFGSLWGVAILMFIAFESGALEEGWLVDRPRMVYVVETAAILLTLGGVPLSLKGFHYLLTHKMLILPLTDALVSYKRWGLVRMAILALIVWGNIWVYYATVETTGGLCALIGLVTSLFCQPSIRRTMNDLKIAES